MKGAAAALAGALLFFLGVLTAASDGDRVSPPPAIPLAGDPASAVASRIPATPAGQPAAPETPEAGDPDSAGNPSAPAAADPAGPAGGAPGDPSAPPAGEEPPAAGGSGGVEEVTGRVDCVDMGPGPGDSSCPPGLAKKGDPPKERGDGDGKG
ncbi:MAG TPA: hypothetical protein VGL92_02035 [Acidimicrobiia bacterium]